MANEPDVVILGAGFAGMGAMKKLEKAPVNVTLIDKNDYHTFLPLLYQVATDELGPSEVGFPLRDMLHGRDGWEAHCATVTGIDLHGKTVSIDGMAPISYDYLVIGLGAVANFYGTEGAPEHSYPLYTMRDAVRLKEHILERLEAADKDPSLVDDGALTFCVVGGGATGVEVSGALAELLHGELRKDFPNLPLDRAEVHVYEMSPHLLGPFKPNLQEYGERALGERDVRVHLGEGVVAIEPTRVRLKSGGTMKAHTLIWGAGIRGNPIAESLGVALERNRVPVEGDLSLTEHPEVFVAGDIAMITDNRTHENLPQLGSVALQAGECIGENIARLAQGKHSEPFEYKDKGTMATVGHGAAVVQFRSGKTMTGNAAWLAWLGVHLMLLSGGEQKGLTFLDWGWNIVTRDQSKRLTVE